MKKIVVRGGASLKGEVVVDGAKNAVLPIVASALLATEGITKLKNVPNLSDVKIISELLTSLGAKVSYNIEEKTLEIDASGKLKNEAEFDFVSKMRASFLVMAPLLVREGVAKVAMPGGCAIGSRPIEQHLKGFEMLGAEIIQEGGYVEAYAKDGLRANTIFFDFPSVGATQNVLMASCLSKGKTILENVAQEPEIYDMIKFLKKMGAKITGENTARLEIEGVDKLVATEHTIMPDRVEAATYMIAAAATKGDVIIKGARYIDNVALVCKMREMGVDITDINGNDMRVVNNKEYLNPINIKTLPHPGFLTDMQSIIMVLTFLADGVSTVTETVFENRFMHVEELKRMNAKIRIEGRSAIIEGQSKLAGTKVKATDLRAGAALIIAGLISEGETIISSVEHIDRGYVDIENKFRQLGANIVRQ